ASGEFMTCSIALCNSPVSSVSGSGCPKLNGIIFRDIPCAKSFEIKSMSFPHEALKAKWLNQCWCLPGCNQLCYCLACNSAQFKATWAMPCCQDHILPARCLAKNWVRVLRPGTQTCPYICYGGMLKLGHKLDSARKQPCDTTRCIAFIEPYLLNRRANIDRIINLGHHIYLITTNRIL